MAHLQPDTSLKATTIRANDRLNRRTIESSMLAVISIVAVWTLRFYIELRVMFTVEVVSVGMVASLAILWHKLPASENRLIYWQSVPRVGLAVLPILTAIIGRFVGQPVAHEMAALTAMGTMSLAIALFAQTSRLRSMSLVISGFLMLFVTSISDNRYAILLAILWMTVCVWHLVANHWERLDVCLPDAVHRGVAVRPLTVLVAVILCVLGSLLVRDQFGESQRFTWGIMPTSGGSDWSDPAARSGVGTGDAVIAAKDHAESFGAVESDIFLEATGSTLFDMFSDSLGQPKIKAKSERRQGLTQQKVIEAHHRTSKSEKGSGSFSTNRNQPVKHEHLRDATERAVLQWVGTTGIRLAMNRFDTFDGVEWTQSADLRKDKLAAKVTDKRTWFFDPALVSRAMASNAVSVGLLKVLRLETTRIPSPMMTAGLHIKDIDRIDFFGIEQDGTYYMPGRDRVPPLTVVNLASLSVTEDELVACTPYEKLQAIVHQLRTEFTLDRNAATNSKDPVAEFLKTKRGGEHLFATTAAMMAREIGFESRLVTGFYVSPRAIDVGVGHANVLPEDVHVWVEIKLDDDRWFEIEPSPGYREPVYTASTWLVAKRFAAMSWPYALCVIAGITVIYLTRRFWIELCLRVTWLVAWLFTPHRQLRVAMWIIEVRAGLAKQRRPVGRPQRDWLIGMVGSHQDLGQRIRRFCDIADQVSFGAAHSIQRSAINDVVEMLTTRTIKQLTLGTST